MRNQVCNHIRTLIRTPASPFLLLEPSACINRSACQARSNLLMCSTRLEKIADSICISPSAKTRCGGPLANPPPHLQGFQIPLSRRRNAYFTIKLTRPYQLTGPPGITRWGGGDKLLFELEDEGCCGRFFGRVAFQSVHRN